MVNLKTKGVYVGNFSVGDTVQLKSGGPVMTVESVDEEGLNCVWFGDVTNIALRQYFTVKTVVKDEVEK